MFRKTLTIFSLIGLLLSVGLWGVSYFNPWYQGSGFEVNLSQGRFFCCWGFRPTGLSRFFWGGFQWSEIPAGGYPTPHVMVPLWIPVTVFGCASTYLLLPGRRRRRRKKLGLCVKCGYDLRGSKERCSECGQEFETT